MTAEKRLRPGPRLKLFILYPSLLTTHLSTTTPLHAAISGRYFLSVAVMLHQTYYQSTTIHATVTAISTA